MATTPRLYAHSLAGVPVAKWEELETHLQEVSSRCGDFTAAFTGADWGRVLGQCHDLGKGSTEFQAMLMRGSPESIDLSTHDRVPGRVDHSTFGARYIHRVAGDTSGVCGWLLAYAVAGHHAGLADWTAGERSTLPSRLNEVQYQIPEVPDPGLKLPSMELPWQIAAGRKGELAGQLRKAAFSFALFTRMIFSSLVDADRLCTEQFCDPDMAKQRQQKTPALAALQRSLDEHLEALQNKAAASPVNSARREVLQCCLAAAAQKPGFFSLQVPTGGGKTLASLAFALHHATQPRHALRRVIVAVPFTTIIEQTADVYRKALGGLEGLALIEHHSNLVPARDTRANQMATENWDAPLIVTTNVQLLESLFAAKTTPCRKLHRVAHSVIILDEAQIMPTDLLEPTLAALRELVDHYGCTIVFCTATQPALERRDDFAIGIEGVRPIIADPRSLFQALHRVEVQVIGPISDDELTGRLATEARVLCVVNTRAHARKLFQNLASRYDAESSFHLSTLMCGAHRRKVLGQLRARLKETDLPVRIVSTQLIEAGVDIDLPVVYRASAGIDSIAQAAGRCNREGKLKLGSVFLFDTENGVPPGFLRQAAETGRETLRRHGADPLSPQAVEEYFRQLYWRRKDEWDKYAIMTDTVLAMDKSTHRIKPEFNFGVIADKYRLIRDAQLPILIPYDEAAYRFTKLLSDGLVDFLPQRRLQPYLANVPKQVFDELARSSVIVSHPSGVGLLMREDAYDAHTGLNIGEMALNPGLWGV